MNRRLLLILLALSAALAASPVHADQGKGGDESDDGEDDDRDDDHGDEDEGDDGGDDNGGGGGDDGGGDNDDSGGDSDDSGGDGDDSGGTGNAPGTGSSSGTSGHTDDHDRAREAVTSDGAIPLRRLLGLFRESHSGEVIDVTLLRRKDMLVYRVKFIDPAGRVRRAEFNARTGESLS